MKYKKFIKVFDLNSDAQKKKKLTPAQILVYGYLHGWNEDHGTGCMVALDTIAAETLTARSTVALAIKRLEVLGWIAVRHGARVSETKNECNVYSVSRFPELTVKYTKKIVVTKNEAAIKIEKSEKQKNDGRKYAMLAIAKKTLTATEYEDLRKLLKV